MDMRALLEKMMKFAGGPDQKQGPAGQLRGGEKMPKKGSKQHPAYHKLVGGGAQESIEDQGNMLKDLNKEAKTKTLEWQLAEEYQAFLEAEFQDTADQRPARKGSREEKYGKRGHKEQPRYKKIKEAIEGDGEEANIIVAEVVKLIGEGHTEVSPDVITAKVSAALGRPFMLKDLVAANNSSPELQHYIDSINPTKIKFSTDILTVKNQDPMKEKEAAQDGVSKMAARAANRDRLAEGECIDKDKITKFHKKLDTLVHHTFGKRKDEVEEAGDRAGALNTATQLKRAIENSQNKPAHEIEYLTKQMNALMRKYNIKPEELQTPTGHQQQSRQQTPPPPPPPKGPGVDWAKHQADFEKAYQANQADFEKAYQANQAELNKTFQAKQAASQAELNKAFQASMPPGMMPKTKMAEESAEQLNVGDDVIITGPVEHQGETGVIDSFGQDKRFVVVNLYNHGKKSFHSSDVSYNDYADSDAEEAEMYDRDPEFRDWAAKQEVDEGWGAEPAAARHREQMTAVAQVLQKYKNDPVKSKIANYLFVNNWNAQAIEKELADPNAQQKFQANMDKYERQVGPVKDWSDKMAADYLQSDQPNVDESQGDPHKILINKLRDIERKPSVPSADDDARRAEQAKADYAKYVAKMRKKDPNFTPLYKMDEYGASSPGATSSAAGTTTTNDPKQLAKVAQATQTLKAATGSTAPTTNLTKAIDAASRGQSVSSTDMKVLEPLMKDVATVAQDPKLAGQFKSILQQVNQAQMKQPK